MYRWIAIAPLLLAFVAPAAAQQLRSYDSGGSLASADVRFLRQPEPLDPPRLPPPQTQPPAIESVDPVPEAEGPSLTLDDLEAMALESNPSLLAAAARTRALWGKWRQAGLPPNPSIGYLANEIGDGGKAGQQGIFINQQIIRGGKLTLSQQIAAQEMEMAQQRLAAQRFRVLNDVRAAFYDVLFAQRNRQLNRRLVNLGDEAVKTSEALFKAQERSRVDLLRAQAAAETARLGLEQAVRQYYASWRTLSALVGRPEMPPARLVGDLAEGVPQLTWEESVNRLLAESPQLARARFAVDRANAALRREIAEPIPDAQFMGGVVYDTAADQTLANVQLGFTVPWWNRNQGAIRRAQAELTAARGDLRRLELQLSQQLAEAYRRYDTARIQVQRYRDRILPRSEEALKLVNQGYRQGEFDYNAVIDAQRTYFSASLDYLQSLRQLRESAVTVKGLLLRGSLQQNFAPAADQ